MLVYVLCERYGRIRDSFLKRGHLAISCDLVPSESDNTFHIVKDCKRLDYSDVDLIIANPPCTYLSNSGVRWLYTEKDRWIKMLQGAMFFRWILELPVPKIVVENPIMHKYARIIIGKEYTQIIQPYQFGHPETKATCLWLKGLPKLIPTDIVTPVFFQGTKGRFSPTAWKTSSNNRGIERSITFTGIAKAMAEQWG